MTRQTWTLTDATQDLHDTTFCLTSDDFPDLPGSWKVSQRTLRCGLSAGVDLIEIDNGRMRTMVIPTRGMGIWKAEIGNEKIGWQSPVRGPVHPQHVPLFDPKGLGWLEGFDELLVRCGLESNGAPDFDALGHLQYPLHGRIANRPAYYVDVTVDSQGEITVRGFVEEASFHFQKLRLEASLTTTIDSTSFTIHDEVENFGGTPAQMQMLYHINIGEPLLTPESKIVAPIHSIRNSLEAEKDNTESWDIYSPPAAGRPEQCFFIELSGDEKGQTQVLLKNASGTMGTALQFNTNCLPCFTLWKNSVASQDGYVTGIEPATNFPNPRTQEAEQGRIVDLSPGEKWSADVTVSCLTQNLSLIHISEPTRPY